MYANLPETHEGAEELWIEDQVRQGDKDWLTMWKFNQWRHRLILHFTDREREITYVLLQSSAVISNVSLADVWRGMNLINAATFIQNSK